MPEVIVRENDSFDVVLRRFKRLCEKAGILSKLREIEYYEKPTAKRKRDNAAMRKRHYKKRAKQQESEMRNQSMAFDYEYVTNPDKASKKASDDE